MLIWFGAAAIVAALVVLVARSAASPDFTPSTTVSQIDVISGSTFQVPAGKPVVLYFMAGWCLSCVPESQALDRVQRGHGTLAAAKSFWGRCCCQSRSMRGVAKRWLRRARRWKAIVSGFFGKMSLVWIPSQILLSSSIPWGSGRKARNAPLRAPTLVPTIKDGRKPRWTSEQRTPTWSAPKLAPPLRTRAGAEPWSE